MSPEQARGQPAGPTADLYALGVVLFEMLTGRVPFDAPVLTAQLLAKVLQPAPLLKDVCPGLAVPQGVQALVGALLERDAALRPSSASAVSERIDGLLADARLPPARRSVQRTVAAGSGVPPTELMLLPNTFDHGWAPPRTDSVIAPRWRPRRFSWALAAAFPLAAAGAFRWELGLGPSAAEPPVAQLASVSATSFTTALAPAPTTREVIPELGDPTEEMSETFSDSQRPLASPAPRVEAPVSTNVASPPLTGKPTRARKPRGVTPAVAAPPPTAATTVRGGAAATIRGGAIPKPPTVAAAPAVAAAEPVSAAAPAAASPITAAADPTAASTPAIPSATPATLEPLPASAPALEGAAAAQDRAPVPASRRRRYPTVAAVDAAEASGEITPLQRNDIIAALRQRRLEARARVAREHRQGLISLTELRERQRAIDREFEGLDRAQRAPAALEPRARKRRLLRIGP
jgi:serine/threonine-protein kinase